MGFPTVKGKIVSQVEYTEDLIRKLNPHLQRWAGLAAIGASGNVP
jgi:hypothetical protein